MGKNIWEKPQLIVLVKQRDVENVLVTCKMADPSSSYGPGTDDFDCQSLPECGSCEGNFSS